MNNNETFIYMGGDMIVPQDVVRVRVHPSVTVIPEKAFHERRRLEEVELNDGLLGIGSYAFSGDCFGLSSLKRIVIPSSVKTIGDHAFYYCEELEEVVLCEGLLEIGKWAFHSCYALKSIRIPSTVMSIHEHTFSCCSGLKDAELCEGLLEVGMAAFFDCKSLERIKIPSTMNVISQAAFKECVKLARVELCEGLIEIGASAFSCSSIKSINIPSTVKTIARWAFSHVPIKNLSLPDNIESIGEHAFWNWNEAFAIARLPSLITTISSQMCRSKELLSIEVSESVERVDNEAFMLGTVLRNLALPSNAEIGFNVFKDCLDLKQLGSERNIIKSLKHRFDNLPIHKMLYYQSYNQNRVLRSNNGSLISMLDDPSIKQQDTLGMIPLHILASSSIQNIELYKVLVEKHPESLITKDRWGALPLLYAVWRGAGSEIIQFLVQSYKSIFPKYELNWTLMMKTLALASADDKFVTLWYYVKKESFPKQDVDWDTIIETAILHSDPSLDKFVTKRAFRKLIIRGVSKRALALRNKSLMERLRRSILDDPINNNVQSRRDFVKNIHEKLAACEEKIQKLMEALTSIELVLWKNKMDDCCGQQKKTRHSKKMRLNDTAMRKQCRLKCGAETNIVIEHVLLYLDKL